MLVGDVEFDEELGSVRFKIRITGKKPEFRFAFLFGWLEVRDHDENLISKSTWSAAPQKSGIRSVDAEFHIKVEYLEHTTFVVGAHPKTSVVGAPRNAQPIDLSKLIAATVEAAKPVKGKPESGSQRPGLEPAEQGDARRPATAEDAKSEGNEKPKPESEGRSR